LNHRAWFIDPANDCNQNAEGVRKCQPRATRWENRLIWPLKTLKEFASETSMAARQRASWLERFANSYRVHKIKFRLFPGRCPGLEFTNAFGVLVRQICIYLWERESKLYHHLSERWGLNLYQKLFGEISSAVVDPVAIAPSTDTKA